MPKTIVALFNERASAETARQDLIRTGLKSDGINIEDSTASLGNRFRSLKDVGMPERHAEAYCEGVRRGGNLLIARVDDNKVATAQEILQRDGAVNVDERMNQWRKTGWDHFDANARPFNADEMRKERELFESRRDDAGSFTIPVIEEEMEIGKREVQGGGVRVRSHVTEQPVDESITLREEHVDVQRRPVNREVSAADMTRMKDETIELTERREEPVVSKKARVKEEITVKKTAGQRTEHVRDTVKKTDVSVDKMETDSTGRSTTDTDARKNRMR